ncbi:MAG: hypothetical protein H6718_01430 [Polyangiaceae bacterium]|nr:hypothetical protein [Myxococcales bacterium]MCB9584024.1 hypothetical protein [Polyangiaceae bacterium]
MSRVGHWLVHQSVTHLLRMACVAALIALSLMSYSVISLKPLPVIFAMSVGHGIGIFAFLCYLLAVILDTRRSAPRTSAAPSPPKKKPSEAARADAAEDEDSEEAHADSEDEDGDEANRH